MESEFLNKADFLRRLIDIFPAIIMIVDNDVKILDINKSALEYFGVDFEDMVDVRNGEAIHCIY